MKDAHSIAAFENRKRSKEQIGQVVHEAELDNKDICHKKESKIITTLELPNRGLTMAKEKLELAGISNDKAILELELLDISKD
jgi:hypothetical protein